MIDHRVHVLRPLSLGLCLVVLLSLVSAMGAPRADAATPALSVTDLRVEGLVDPIGIDSAYTDLGGVVTNKPRLSWIPTSTFNDQQQTAFRVQVAATVASLTAGSTLWDTGKVMDGGNAVMYNGPAVTSGTRYFWRVQVWDAQGEVSAWSPVGMWQMGLLDDAAWKSAQWIGASASSTAPREAVVLLRKQFANAKTVSRATLTVAGLGYQVSYVNGQPVNDHLMDPPWTAYDKRINYVSTDVTGLISTGAGSPNAIGIALAGGWYDNRVTDPWGNQAASWVAKVRARVVLDLIYTDGTTGSVVSDPTWSSGTGEVTYSTSRGGEDIDHTKSAAGWNAVEFSGAWSGVAAGLTPAGTPALRPMMLPPVTRSTVAEAVGAPTVSPAGTPTAWYTYKLVDNTTGIPQLTLKGSAGTVVTVQVGEGLDASGQVDPAWHGLNSKVLSGGRWQLARFTLRGDATAETFLPQFTYFAGQYVTVKVVSGSLTQAPGLSFYAVHNDVDIAGTFTSSDTVLNKVHSAAVRTYLNNLQGAPLDSTQRERIGYGGDGAVTTAYALQNFAGIDRLLSDWARTFGDQQRSDGFMYWVAPSPGWVSAHWYSPWWPNAAVIVPNQVAAATGDLRQLTMAYPAMRRWADYLWSAKLDPITRIYNTSGFPSDHEAADSVAGFDVPFNTLGVLAALRGVAEAAERLGQSSDSSLYASRFETVRNAFNTRWFSPSQHTYSAVPLSAGFSRAAQSILAVALSLGVVPAAEDAAVYASLLDEIAHPTRNSAWADHQTTGIIGTYYLFQLLADRGAGDVARTMLTQPTYPSVAVAATSSGNTIWERIVNDGLSHSHPAFASVDNFLYRGLAGIDADRLVSHRQLTIAPIIPNGMTSASASQKTALGTVSSGWSVEGSTTTYSLTVPVGVTADVFLPVAGMVTVDGNVVAPAFADGRPRISVGSGTHLISSVTFPTGSDHRIENTSDQLTYAGTWRSNSGLRAEYWPDGQSHSTTATGSSVSYRCISCSRVTWWSTAAKDRGLASVSIDGGAPVIVDTYRAGLTASSAVFTSPTLRLGTHTLTVQALGTKNPSSTGTAVEVDAFGSNSGPAAAFIWGVPASVTSTPTAAASGISAVSAGWSFATALTSTGKVLSWGSIPQSVVPGAAGGGVVDIAAGSHHTIALRQDGTVLSWGVNNAGQINVPVGLTGVVDVDAGFLHSIAVKSDGRVVAWGNTGIVSTLATDAAAQRNVRKVASGENWAVFLHSDGTVTQGGEGISAVPSGLAGVVDVVAGKNTAYALRADGSVVTWGAGAAPPTNVPPLARIFARGTRGVYGLSTDGSVVSWGSTCCGWAAAPFPPDLRGHVMAVDPGWTGFSAMVVVP